MQTQSDETIEQLIQQNKEFQQRYKEESAHHVKGQSPKIAILTCADSRVVPEFIFNAGIGELFVVRLAGNIAVDETVIASLEYAVDHLNVSHLIILGHSFCGAVKATEQSPGSESLLLSEIEESFCIDESDHIQANLKRQLQMLPKRSKSIEDKVSNGLLHLVGAVYHIEDGHVEFI